MFSQYALLIIDAQNAFCSKFGSFWKRGYRLINLKQVILNLKKLIMFARENNLPIIFTKTQFKSDYSNAGLLISEIAPEIPMHGAYKEDTWDGKIAFHLNAGEKEIVIIKSRYDAFYNTDLLQKLKSFHIKTLIIAGFITNVCVESTVRSAFDRDFKVIVAMDATTTYSKLAYNASLFTIKRHFGKIMKTSEIIRLINKELDKNY